MREKLFLYYYYYNTCFIYLFGQLMWFKNINLSRIRCTT